MTRFDRGGLLRGFFLGLLMIDFGVGSSLGKKIGATLLMEDRETLD